MAAERDRAASCGLVAHRGRRMFRLPLLAFFFAAQPYGAGADAKTHASCARDGVKIGDGQCSASFAEVHKAIVEITNRCLRSQSDVYQRFSGYAIKYHMGRLCEKIGSFYDGLQRLAFVGANARSGIHVASSPEDLAVTAAALLRDLEDAFSKMLLDTNSQGDGSLELVLREHLESFAGSMAQAAMVAAEQSHVPGNWPEVVTSLTGAFSKLVNVVFDSIEQGVTYNIGKLSVTDLPRFLRLLDSFPAAVPVEVRRASADEEGHVSRACVDVPSIYRAQHVFDPVADPISWRDSDVSGLTSPRPSVLKLLFTLAKMVPLSYNYIEVAPRTQVGAQEVTDEFKGMFHATGGRSAASSVSLTAAAGLSGGDVQLACGGVGLAYSPVDCLFTRGWGSMTFSLNTEPPFDGVLSVSEMSQKGAEERPRPFVQPVTNESSSLDQLIDLVDAVYKSLNTPSPDVLFLSPMVGNCLTLRKLGPSRRDVGVGGTPQLTPKLVWVPINPLVPPPWEFAPNFTEWHHRLLSGKYRPSVCGEAAWWYAQCSLSSTSAVLRDQGYVLLHLEHTFAVFVLKGLWPAVESLMQSRTDATSGMPSMYDHWLRGWYCSSVAPTLFGLEHGAGASELKVLLDRRASSTEQDQALCNFAQTHGIPLVDDSAARCSVVTTGEKDVRTEAVADPSSVSTAQDHVSRRPQSWRTWELQDPPQERGSSYLLESTGRGRCLQSLGFCECFPPYRGRFCDDVEPGRLDDHRPYKAVLHYLVADKERLLADFVHTLPILWDKFNQRFDYPVVVFHDGLSADSRQRILEASLNRLWFAYVDDYTSVPAYLAGRLELELGGYSLGYRGMCRFRSGPMFTQPVMSQFDYAWTLDTDGYFPAEIKDDPFERMWLGNYAYGYSHISRDQASAVQHFWEFCRLYVEAKGLDPKGTKMMRRITDALVLRDTFWHEWNRVLFMNDIEITQLSWFRGAQYQDFFRFLDSVGGFWLYRWGDHAVRTIAIAMWMDPGRLMKMEVPYGHQNTCRCGKEHPDSVCVRTGATGWWGCIPRSEAAQMLQVVGESTGSGDVGTVHDSLMFGGT